MFRCNTKERLYHAFIKRELENEGYLILYHVFDERLYSTSIYSKKWENYRLKVEEVGKIENLKVITNDENLRNVASGIEKIIEEREKRSKLPNK